MDVYLDDIRSLFLLRATRRGDLGLTLGPSTRLLPTRPTLSTCKLRLLGMSDLLRYMGIPEAGPLGIVVPHPKDRVRSKGITSKVCSRLRGATPFLKLGQDGASVSMHGNADRLISSSNNVFVMSPTNVVLGMAARLTQRVRTGSIGYTRATLMLVKLCLELCGTYVHDPFDPLDGRVTYDTTPATSAEELRREFAMNGGERGLRLARRAAAMSYNLSGSPQESFMGPGLFFSSKFGGLELADFEANVPLDLSMAERQSIGHRIITPDFTMKSLRSVVEYLGSVHLEGDNPNVDHVRSLDYQTLGYREFAFWYDDVATRARFMQSAARIAAMIEQLNGGRAQARFAKLGSNKEFVERQRALFEVFRPWLR